MLQILPFVVMAVIIGGYYFYYYKLGGKERFANQYKKRFGLRDGEVLHGVYTGYYAIERTTGEKIAGAFGQGVRGAHTLLGLSNFNALLIGHNETGGDPMRFEVGQIQVAPSPRKGDHKKLVGPTGASENTAVVHLQGPGANMHLTLPESAANALHKWAQGGGVPPLPTGA